MIAVAEYERTIQQAFREVADLLAARDKLAVQLAALEAAEKAQTIAEGKVHVEREWPRGTGLVGFIQRLLIIPNAERVHPFRGRWVAGIARPRTVKLF